MPSEDWERRPCTPLRVQHMRPRCQLRSLPGHPKPLSPSLPPDNPVGPTLGELVLDLAVDVAEELDVSHGCLKQQRAHACSDAPRWLSSGALRGRACARSSVKFAKNRGSAASYPPDGVAVKSPRPCGGLRGSSARALWATQRKVCTKCGRWARTTLSLPQAKRTKTSPRWTWRMVVEERTKMSRRNSSGCYGSGKRSTQTRNMSKRLSPKRIREKNV